MAWQHRPKLRVGAVCKNNHRIASQDDLYTYRYPGKDLLTICKACQLTRGKTRRKRDANAHVINGNTRTAAEKALARVEKILDVMNAARVEHIGRTAF